jgi:hypothetical protein
MSCNSWFNLRFLFLCVLLNFCNRWSSVSRIVFKCTIASCNWFSNRCIFSYSCSREGPLKKSINFLTSLSIVIHSLITVVLLLCTLRPFYDTYNTEILLRAFFDKNNSWYFSSNHKYIRTSHLQVFAYWPAKQETLYQNRNQTQNLPFSLRHITCQTNMATATLRQLLCLS